MGAKILVGIHANETGIFGLDSSAVGDLPDPIPAEGTIVCRTQPINLTPGRCHVNVALFRGGILADHVEYAAYFDVEPDDVFGSGRLPPRNWALCLLQNRWTYEGD